MISSDLSNALRAVSSGLQIPVMVILLFIIGVTVLLVGTLIGEIFTERRHMKQNMPEFADRIQECAEESEKEAENGSENKNTENVSRSSRPAAEKAAEVIRASGLLKRQKKALIELTEHGTVTPLMRESMAVRLLHEERSHYEKILKISDIISRIGPMFGLLGTLIPLGPGIIALGQGDTYTLSTSLLTAFDTTVAGLISAAVAFMISAIRRSWYSNYMSALEMAAECVLEVMKNSGAADAPEKTGSAADPSEEA